MEKIARQIEGLRTAWARSGLTRRDAGRVALVTLALFLALAWGWLQIGPAVFVLLLPPPAGIPLALHPRLFRKTVEHQRQSAAEAQNIYRQIESIVSLSSTLGISYPLPPLGVWTISPDLGLLLASLVLQRQPRMILEMGSGASTVVLGYCLRRLGRGRIVSIDHDAYFVEESRRSISTHKLDEVVTVVHAPLRTIYLDQKQYPWYDISKLPAIEAVDLLVIDGPPDHRYPALPMLHHLL